ncbi:F-actin-monooxygenase MICAL3 isoform X23 [Lissotriton helveticus]
MDEVRNEKVKQAHVLFDKFVQASTCKGTLKGFQELCDYLELKPRDYRSFYYKLKSKLSYWKAKALWSKLDKRGCHKDFKKGKACSNTKCLIIGAGPCGLRTAIDLSLLGAKVVVVEKRDAFSRNNVLHLWPFTINDLRGLGAKKFYGKFCAGAIDHISIRQLQLILLKVALILGIEIHVGVEFQGLIEPPEDQENRRIGWRAEVHPKTHMVSEYEFDVIIGADGRRNTLEGFRRKEFRGKLAIAITANFINRNTTAEAKVEEISGVAFIFNQKFFQDLREATGVDLENIVYYKDDTHYFVMTAKKQSLLEKGVILHDYADTELLLSRANVDQEALLSYAREAADFSTNQQLPSLDFAINHYGQPDVAMFDFTCMYASENAALVRERNGHRLLVALVGDSLLEPFWPMGTGIARGFLAAMDSAWMVRSWSLGANPLEVLAERESIYRLLPQTTPENVNKNFSQYSIDPSTRYPNISVHVLRPNQVRHLYNTNELKDFQVEMENLVNSRTPRLGRNESVARSSKLLGWCQKLTEGYAGVNVTDLTMSWKSGLALCAIVHKCRPDLIDFDSLDERCVERTNQLAFDIAEKEFGISPIMTGKEMASVGEPDKLSMVMYLTQFYEMFKDTVPAGDNLDLNVEEKAALIASAKSPISFFSKLGQTISRKRTPKDKKEKESEGVGKRRKTSQSEDDEVPRSVREERPTLVSALTERRIDAAVGNQNKVKSMANQLLAKFEENAPAPNTGLRRQCSFRKEFPQNIGGSDVCYFCGKRVYVMERLSAEAKFFHRSCFKCDYCNATLRLSSYAYDLEDGKFYCKPHYCYRLSGYGQRKRPAAPSHLGKENKGPLKDAMATEEIGRTITSAASTDRTPACNVNGVEDHSLAKRLRGTPERIELENYRVSLQREEELEEVPEETLAEHNLSSVLDQRTEQDAASSSSESEMEEEDEEEEDDEEDQAQAPSSDLGGVPWKEAVRIHALLKGQEEGNSEAEKAPEAGVLVEENGEEEEDGEAEDEEDDESSEAGNLKLQQAIQPVDPLEIQADVHWTHIRVKKEEEEENDERVSTEGSSCSKAPDHPSLRHEAVRAWLESVSGAPCEEEGAEDEVGTGNAEAEDTAGGDGNTCADLVDDDIPSDAEAEERLHHLELEELKPDVEEVAAAHLAVRKGPSKPTDSVLLPKLEFNVLVPAAASFSVESKETAKDIKDAVLLSQFVKSPEERFFPEPFLPPDSHIADSVKSPSALISPIRSRLLSLEDATIPRPFTQRPFKSTPISSTVVSPTTTSPLASPVAISPLVPTVASNPLAPAVASRTLPPMVASSPVAPPMEDSPLAPLVVAGSPLAFPANTSPLTSPVTASLFTPKAASPLAPFVASSLLSPKASSPLSPPVVTSPLQFSADASPIVLLDAISHVVPSVSTSPLLLPVSSSPLASSVLTTPQPASVDTTTRPSPVTTGPVAGHWPVRSQPLPSTDLSAHTTDKSPVCLQPTPVITSTPLLKLAITSQVGEPDRLASPSAEEALKRNDLIEEFWMKSAEIRRSLGLTPVDRSKSFSVTSVDVTSVRSNSTPSVQDASVLEEHRVASVRPRTASHRINASPLVDEKLSPLTPKSPSDKELRSSNGEKKDLSSSSGLGLNWSSCNTRTMASESFNTSDSTMLTPPSSPPPPPPQNEEPATLRKKAPKVSLQNSLESKLSPVSPPLTRKSSSGTKEPAQLQREELRKSFVESVDEIPFADDVEDTYDDRTEDSSFNEQFFTPPTSRPVRLHGQFPKENGESLDRIHQKKRLLPTVSPEAKELAEERMRAREKSVKSQALRDALAVQLCKMKELELAAAATSAHVTSSVSHAPSGKTSVGSTKTKELLSDSPKSWVFKASEAPTLKHELANDLFLLPPAEGSVTSSEGSTGKSKKRASLFSPRKNKKEKKSKNDSSRLSDKLGPTPDEATKPRSLWKTVFSGYKKDKKKKQQLQQQADDQSCPSTPSSSTTVDSGKAKASALGKAPDLQLRRHLSFSEESDLSSDDVLERSSQRSKRESVYVPHALAFKRSYATKKAYTEEELSAKLTRRVQKAARRQAKQEELKRLHRAQIIQRQLEQVEEKQRQLEERGVAVEKALRGEAGMGKKDDPKLMQEWFKLVQEKNALVRYESELMIFARELELEDRQSRLQQELRERMAVEDHLKTEKELTEEKKILNEMLDVVEQRDALVALLEEQRLQEKEEDKDLESVMLTKGFNLNWS